LYPIVYIVLWFPTVVYRLVGATDAHDAPAQLHLVTAIIAPSQATFNFLVYTTVNKNVRKRIYDKICCKKRKRAFVYGNIPSPQTSVIMSPHPSSVSSMQLTPGPVNAVNDDMSMYEDSNDLETDEDNVL
jgi:hypothetical protein